MFVFVADTRKPMCVSFVHLLVKHSALQLPCYLELAAKQYCTDHGTANAVQLIAVIKGNVLVYSSTEQVTAKGISPETN